MYDTTSSSIMINTVHTKTNDLMRNNLLHAESARTEVGLCCLSYMFCAYAHK